MPIVYCTAMYCLEDIARIEAGKVCISTLQRPRMLTYSQTILIHSAAGGVGIAAIQLAQMVEAEVSLT
jgi:phthiocerol/phenolphthiocerol synthesis type-I polyketide synthase C